MTAKLFKGQNRLKKKKAVFQHFSVNKFTCFTSSLIHLFDSYNTSLLTANLRKRTEKWSTKAVAGTNKTKKNLYVTITPFSNFFLLFIHQIVTLHSKKFQCKYWSIIFLQKITFIFIFCGYIIVKNSQLLTTISKEERSWVGREKKSKKNFTFLIPIQRVFFFLFKCYYHLEGKG